MSFIYVQLRGVMLSPVSDIIGRGYSGQPECKNNPAEQDLKGKGCIPRGTYTIEKPAYDHPKCGPFVLSLTPHPKNEMFGRGGFLIHGDNIKFPGTASDGCIIMPRPTRQMIAESPDNILVVI